MISQNQIYDIKNADFIVKRRLIIPLLPKYEISNLYIAIFSGCISGFVSDLVGNPEDNLSHNVAQINESRHTKT